MCEYVLSTLTLLYSSRETTSELSEEPDNIWINYTISSMTKNMVEGSSEVVLRDHLRRVLGRNLVAVIDCEELTKCSSKYAYKVSVSHMDGKHENIFIRLEWK